LKVLISGTKDVIQNGEPMTKDCSFLLFLTIRGRRSVSDLSEWSDLASNQTPFDQERRPGSDDAMRTSSKTLLFFSFLRYNGLGWKCGPHTFPIFLWETLDIFQETIAPIKVAYRDATHEKR
jgi:hypothetical protein